MALLDTGHSEAPLALPVLYPFALIFLKLGFSDPTQPVYWPLPVINSTIFAYLCGKIYAQRFSTKWHKKFSGRNFSDSATLIRKDRNR